MPLVPISITDSRIVLGTLLPAAPARRLRHRMRNFSPLHNPARTVVLRAPQMPLNYRGLSTVNCVIVNPNAAPKNTSDGKCACVVTREKLIAPATPYATHGTHRCRRYRCANTVAMENAPAA